MHRFSKEIYMYLLSTFEGQYMYNVGVISAAPCINRCGDRTVMISMVTQTKQDILYKVSEQEY
jgi:hypothetical protein